MSKNIIITIGREYGSGGHEIATKLAEKLNIKCYDKEILTASAKKSGFTEQVFQEYDETSKNSLLFSIAAGIGSYGFGNHQSLSTQLYLEQFKTMKEIAQNESCIFVGRCADYVLREFDNVLNVFIHAPLENRIERISNRNQVSAEKAKEMIAKADKTRASYYNYYTNQKWGSAKHYNLSIDSGKIGIEGAVKLLESYLQINRK